MSCQGRSCFNFCGGTLISKDWVITAAHCYSADAHSNTYAMVGENEICHFGKKNLINGEWKVHPSYDTTNLDNDIALLKLKKSVKFGRFVGPACIQTSTDYTAIKHVYVTGWGLTIDGENDSAPKVMHSVDIRDV